jgi:hypothetical protein
MTRLFAVALLATVATTAYAAEPQKPAPGTSWAKVTYEVGNDGDAMTCKVLETNFEDADKGQDVCATILSKWKFEKSTRGETVTQYVVVKPGKG